MTRPICHNGYTLSISVRTGVSSEMLLATQAKGEGYCTTSNSRHFMAVFLLKMHQIFMLALAKLRCVRAGGSGARCFAACPLAFLVFLLSDWWEACATSPAVGGEAPGPVRQERGTGRGRLPPNPAVLEVTRPEPRNERRNIRKTFSFPN
jgi:hypothetical protein